MCHKRTDFVLIRGTTTCKAMTSLSLCTPFITLQMNNYERRQAMNMGIKDMALGQVGKLEAAWYRLSHLTVTLCSSQRG